TRGCPGPWVRRGLCACDLLRWYSGYYTRRKAMVARQVTLKALRGEAARYQRPETAKEGAILEAATRLFGARGYASTRTADIAAAAGVTERTLFRYFPSKEKLYRRVMFPALLAAAAPRAPMAAGELFGKDAGTADPVRLLLDGAGVGQSGKGYSGSRYRYPYLGPRVDRELVRLRGLARVQTWRRVAGAL